MNRSLRQSGFTLLELVLVMAIIVIALAVAAPSLRGWGRGAKLRNAADEMLTLTRYAQSQAVTDGRVYRLNLDASAGNFWLTAQDGSQFINLSSSIGQVCSVPEGARIETSGASSVINFYPTGRIDPAQIRITMDDGSTIGIECAAPSESFHVVVPGASS